jgi:hypothetical protein
VPLPDTPTQMRIAVPRWRGGNVAAQALGSPP